LIAAFAFTATALGAQADTPPQNAGTPLKQTIPQSVWQVDNAGNALHVQSQWHCPANFGDYRRHDLHTYDAFGLDVSCDYLSPGVGDITLYLTKRTGGDINIDLENGKTAILKRTPDAAPAPPSEQKKFTSDREWLYAGYSRKNGAVLEGLWYAWFGDWEFEIRATYAAVQSDAVMSTLGQMTRAASETAAHLERCTRSDLPSRDGIGISDSDATLIVAFTASAMVEAMPEGEKFRPDPSKLTIEWCAEGGAKAAGDPVVLWHGLIVEGRTVEADRASSASIGNPIVIESIADSELNKIEAELKRPDLPVFAVTHKTEQGDVNVLGFFSRRPSGETLAQFVSEIAHSGVNILGSYNPKTKKITIVTPKETPQ